MTLDRLRIALNMVCGLGLFVGSIYLLGQDSFRLGNRWDPRAEIVFQGVALYCLAFGLTPRIRAW